MKFECKDLESVLRSPEPELIEAATAHAGTCPECWARLQLWEEISAAAKSLHKSWDSPDLWPRIHQALAVESQRIETRPVWKRLAGPFGHWPTVAATLGLIFILGAGAWMFLRQFSEPAEEEKRLLTEQALSEVERAEEAYVRSIERLSKVVEPQVEQASSPILVSYREKLMLIDAGIAACQANIENNRFNAHLRAELLSIYRDKEATLISVIREAKNAQN